MGYDNPQREVYSFLDATFGATTVSHQHIGPKGKVGIVRDIEVDIDVTLVGSTTAPEVTVGATAGASEYARFRLGTAAGTPYAANTTRRARQISAGQPTFEDFTGHVKLETAQLPADTQFVISNNAGTGGSPAGGGLVRVTIDWF